MILLAGFCSWVWILLVRFCGFCLTGFRPGIPWRFCVREDSAAGLHTRSLPLRYLVGSPSLAGRVLVGYR